MRIVPAILVAFGLLGSAAPAFAQSADGLWECRVEAVPIGTLDVDGSSYTFRIAQGGIGDGELQLRGIESEMVMQDVTGFLAGVGFRALAVHVNGESASLILYDAFGPAATCLHTYDPAKVPADA